MSVMVLPCGRLTSGTGRHGCVLTTGHPGDCACRCDPCLDRADRLAAY